jgi:hypothetical protein
LATNGNGYSARLMPEEREWVRDTAYFLWIEAGRPEGRSPEFWREALEQHRRNKAYRLWLDEGRPEGHAEDHWHETAERQPQ